MNLCQLLSIEMPNMVYVNDNCSSNTIKNIIFPKKINNWSLDIDNFENFIENYSDRYENYKVIEKSIDIVCEEDLRFLFITLLKEIFQYRIFKNHNVVVRTNSLLLKSNTDIVIEYENTPIFIVEMKKKGVLKNDENYNLVSYYKKHFIKRENGNSGKICKCVDQIYNYMIVDGVGHSLLTSIDESWLMKIENSNLYITNRIEKYDLLKTIFFILRKLICDKKVMNIQVDINLQNYDVFKKIKIKNVFDNSFFYLEMNRLTELVGYGRTGKVYRLKTQVFYMDFTKEEDFAIKITDISKLNSDDMKQLKNERIILKRNKNKCSNLQRLFGYKKYINYNILATFFIDGKSCISFSQLTENEKALAIESVKKMHDVNIIHNDLHPGNFLFSENCAFIIDFGKSRFISEKFVFKKNNELDELINEFVY